MNPDDTRLITTGLLAVYLGGSEDSFTGLLLNLIAKADPGNKSRLRLAFPEVVRAYEVWMSMEPAPTWAEMTEAMGTTGGKVLPVPRIHPAVTANGECPLAGGAVSSSLPLTWTARFPRVRALASLAG